MDWAGLVVVGLQPELGVREWRGRARAAIGLAGLAAIGLAALAVIGLRQEFGVREEEDG